MGLAPSEFVALRLLHVYVALLIFGSACVEPHTTNTTDTTSVPVDSAEFAIIGGVPNSYDSWVGMLSVELLTCSLTAVYDRFTLTARHCVQERNGNRLDPNGRPFDPNSMQVTFAQEPGVQPDALWYQVVDFRWHHSADLAVVELNAPAPTWAPMNYQNIDGMAGEPVRIAGYGLTRSSPPEGRGIKRVGYTNLSRTATFRDLGEVMVTQPLTAANGAKLCQGDSGGPSFMTINGVEVLVGVNSVVAREGPPTGGAIPCEAPDVLNAHVRVDRHQQWINEAIADMDGGSTTAFGGCSAGSTSSAGWLLLAGVIAALRRRRHKARTAA
jgi:MYXO-CTERM domain-containing protein